MRFPILLVFLSINLIAQEQTSVFDSLELKHTSTIYFDFGASSLRPQADTTLRELLAAFQQVENPALHLKGHTDAIGSEEANLLLSQHRADTVKAQLKRLGISDTLMRVQSFGESLPANENESDEGRQQNRRVTVELYHKSSYVYLTGQIQPQEDSEEMEAMVIVKQEGRQDSIKTDAQGNFKIAVPENTAVGIEAYAKGYFFETQKLEAQDIIKQKLEMNLAKAEAGAIVDIDNLYFVGGEAILMEHSVDELPKVLQFMQLNPNLKIEIGGHIDMSNSPPVAEDSWYFNLSVRRAEMVYNYLAENGISTDRMSYQGYGNFRMRYPKAKTSKEMEENRRVEIKVVEVTSEEANNKE